MNAHFVLHRLCERQTKSGGLNGRPEKLQDVCYSWWCLSALAILDRLHWIDRDALCAFILQCQVRFTPPAGAPRSGYLVLTLFAGKTASTLQLHRACQLPVAHSHGMHALDSCLQGRASAPT